MNGKNSSLNLIKKKIIVDRFALHLKGYPIDTRANTLIN